MVYKNDLIICKVNGFNLELIRKININLQYNYIYFSNYNLYIVPYDIDFINNKKTIYCFDLENINSKLVGNTDVHILNIECSKETNFDNYINEAIQYKEDKYLRYKMSLTT